jgi:hypothetical protein
VEEKATKIRGTAQETHASYGFRPPYVGGSSFFFSLRGVDPASCCMAPCLLCLVQWIWEWEWKLASAPKVGHTVPTNKQQMPMAYRSYRRQVGSQHGSTAGRSRPPSAAPRTRGCMVRWSALQRRGSCPPWLAWSDPVGLLPSLVWSSLGRDGGPRNACMSNRNRIHTGV